MNICSPFRLRAVACKRKDLSCTHAVAALSACLLLAGCYGQKPPPPQAGGAGPAELRPVFVGPVSDAKIPHRLPDLLAAYRARLLAMAHPFPPGVAQQFADAEILSLHRRYAGRDESLRAALMQKLRPTASHPGTPDQVRQAGPLYPPDIASPGEGRKAR